MRVRAYGRLILVDVVFAPPLIIVHYMPPSFATACQECPRRESLYECPSQPSCVSGVTG